jgi:hypothetical protein
MVLKLELKRCADQVLLTGIFQILSSFFHSPLSVLVKYFQQLLGKENE